MRDGDEFRRTVRRGVSASTATVVVHVNRTGDPGVRVGLVVGKSVGDAVTRNRVKRRVRHAIRPELGGLPDGTRIVVRALPAAAGHPDLPSEVVHSLHRATRRGRG